MRNQHLYFILSILVSTCGTARYPAQAETSLTAPKDKMRIELLKRDLYSGNLNTTYEQCKLAVKDSNALAEHYFLYTLSRLYHEPQPAAKAADMIATRGLRKFPKNANLLSVKAFSLILSSRPSEARSYVAEAIKMNSKSAFAYAVLASCDASVQNVAQAQALRFGAEVPEVNFALCKMHIRHGDEATALKDLARWIGAHPEQALPRFMRANLLLESRRFDSALVDLTSTIRLNSKLKSAYHKRGRVFFEKAKYKEAIADWNQFEKLGGEAAGVFSRRAACHQKLKQYRLAIDDYGKAIAVSKQEAAHAHEVVRCMSARAELLLQIGDIANARTQSDAILALDPTNSPALNIVQIASIKQKDWKTALAALTKLIAIDNDVSEWYSARSAVYKNLGMNREADSDARRAKTLEEKGI